MFIIIYVGIPEHLPYSVTTTAIAHFIKEMQMDKIEVRNMKGKSVI